MGMIETDNLTKNYNGFSALDGVSFRVKYRETVVVVGPSGSGKTTLLRLIAGLEVPDTGEVIIQGEPASGPGAIFIPPNRRNASMIFQDLALWPHMTVEKNLAFVLKPLKLSKTRQAERIRQVCDLVGLDGRLESFPHTLSGGEKQRVAIARAILPEPKIMLMDEPLTSLDAVLKDEILDMILRLKREFQMTLIYVTHDREETFRLDGNIVVMTRGRVVQTGRAESISRNPQNEFAKRFMRRN